MRQILFIIPLDALNAALPAVPIYGYGLMLFFAFIATNWLAARMCKREGIDPKLILDMAIWLFVAGIIGARTVYVIQYWHTFTNVWQIPKLWDGGLVFYGSMIGGVIGYSFYHRFFLRQHGVSTWKMLDVIAPCIAVGLALGRIGCLFTGCCFGNVACDSCPSLHFPLASAPAREMVSRGLQTPLGFLLKARSLEVQFVEPGSAAEAADLRANDVIVEINGKPARDPEELWNLFDTVQLTVLRDSVPVQLPEYAPTSIGVHPTQIYETISMVLLVFFLLSYYPFKRRDGELMVFLMLGYGVHRFLNEMLRTDTDPVAFGLTLSQNISLGVLAFGVVLGVLVWRRPLIAEEPAAPMMPTEAPPTA